MAGLLSQNPLQSHGERDLQKAWEPPSIPSRKWRRLSEAGLLGVVRKGPHHEGAARTGPWRAWTNGGRGWGLPALSPLSPHRALSCSCTRKADFTGNWGPPSRHIRAHLHCCWGRRHAFSLVPDKIFSLPFFPFLFPRGSSKIEEACEIYARAANMFKMAKNWSGT